jgi:DNA-binding MarR family transcriptional regulator
MSEVKRKKLNQKEAESTAMRPPESVPPQPETIAAADRLHSAAIHLLRRVRRQDAATGIGPAQLSALSVLVFAGPKTLGELATAEQIKPPTMSRIVAGLKRSHLIEITHDSHDARRLRISPTAKGTRLLQQGRERRIAYLAAHLASLTPNELSQISTAAEILEMLLRRWQFPPP